MTHFQFEIDHSPEVERAREAWHQVGGGRVALVERLVDVKHNRRRIYKRSGIFRLPGVGMGGTAVVAKSGDAKSLSIEAFVYAKVLPQLSLPAPAYYGYIEDGSHSWLFMEEVVGEPFSPRSSLHRELAVQWLARLHSGTSRLHLVHRLSAEGPDQYFRYVGSTRAAILSTLDTRAPDASRLAMEGLLGTLDIIEGGWNEVCQRCAEMPQCLVHADFVNKNVVVRRGPRPELLALDWGISGWGVPAPDLEYLDPTEYFPLVKPVWPRLQLSDIAYLRTVGIVMRQLGIVDAWASCLRDLPAWTMARLADPAVRLAEAAADMRGQRA